jgi:malonate decarboxylase holo-[acyl-carrier-protein] synthase
MFKRHDLLLLNEEGLNHGLKTMTKVYNIKDKKWQDFLTIIRNENIPAIVKRQEFFKEGYLFVGFSSYLIEDGVRLRGNSEIPLSGIKEMITPFDVIKNHLPGSTIAQKEVISKIQTAGERTGFCVGIYGSTALEMVTSKPYCRQESDLDIYIRREKDFADLQFFYQEIEGLEQETGYRIDVEVECRVHYGVKLKELISDQKTVLAKGLYEVDILNKQELLMTECFSR